MLFVPATILLIVSGLYLSIKSKWMQIFKLPLAISLIFKKSNNSKFSSIAALCTVIGGNLGVGNISGTAIAIKSGGPGFILWMIIVIVITSIIKYVTCYLSISTKVQQNGKVFGGPVVYLQHAFKSQKASLVFAVIMIICSFTIGNLVQVNSLSIPMHLINKPPIIIGLLMVGIFLMLTTLQIKSITKIISSLVPVMTISYILLSIIVLYKFNHNIIPSFKLIFENFISWHSITFGTISAFIIETFHIIQVGTFRGIFATDIGLGLEGTVHASVEHNKQDKISFNRQQSLIALISPFIVVLITFITTMILLVTNVWYDTNLESTNMCIAAFKTALHSQYINYILITIMFCFSFTTIFTWFFCSKNIILYTFKNNHYIKLWTIFFIAIIPIGSICRVQFLWDIADLAISLTIIMNTIGILMLIHKYKDIFAHTDILK
ncbi:sodium:alanine symporter family protein [Neoehrlichia mikurensis]|nr:alanine:cation symporter family protein [Neoehrlichia mikurensis]QXK91816.1 sodium:alanine symporter family protein [Neoehrlichia mikurensis]QXK93029.1 sodium:alanine symporter family protein [Neoehrlichia mikurensis]QXK93507.1 sodium:alanine symporter family protein [Neoehrlichia mikurensis]UTO56460.1 alanine:cation symporter family protein [Neoehrlichia mikurensis]